MFNTYLFNGALYNQGVTTLNRYFTIFLYARTLTVQLYSRTQSTLFHARTKVMALLRKATL